MQIRAVKDGPLVFSGLVARVDAQGNRRLVEGKATAVCRCGRSAEGLLCDGEHVGIGFRAEAWDLVVEEGDDLRPERTRLQESGR